ncbi:glutathione S-transferase [Aliiglaciecola sp. LCG003]|uniref:glutathione S-transferase n=1 Tax=Aliiglaciecola sp. LCG003 TaxID=3053655 RepID=UPI0025727347|nr:glutathione S-transferase [Aliiglaciecola sp. LCG003]WJG09635.1 glutathione S-transferase [Aliiglaciecola sp. LCG003]
MIVVHHLNNSRSQRVLWLLEELNLEYEIKHYQRDPQTNLAPNTLKLVHPLGKSPVITDGDITVAESGAIIEYLIETYGEQLKPAANSESRRQYTYWLHFAEGSLMPPMVAKLVLDKVRAKASPFFIKIVAGKIVDKVMQSYYSPIIQNNMSFVNSHLENNSWFAGEQLSGADFQMSFPLEASVARGVGKDFPAIERFVKQVHEREAYKRALSKGGDYDYA